MPQIPPSLRTEPSGEWCQPVNSCLGRPRWSRCPPFPSWLSPVVGLYFSCRSLSAKRSEPYPERCSLQPAPYFLLSSSVRRSYFLRRIPASVDPLLVEPYHGY